QIIVEIPTIEQEATSIWRTINDIEFLEGQGYNIHLPEHAVIDSLIEKSKNKTFGNSDFESIYTLLESGVYSKSTYEAAFEKVNLQKELINSLVTRLKHTRDQWKWKFKTFEAYKIVFTLYGTGGSYDPDLGIVTLFTNKDGRFMNYDSPANTILHEIVHMGIEESIVQKFNLSHGLKERIVDTITYLLFKEELPDYRIQQMGDPKIDQYLSNIDDLGRLSILIKEYQEEN
ncbi:MAG: hypothetical protein AAFO82_10275, partial [Bacteroidota bacterium]